MKFLLAGAALALVIAPASAQNAPARNAEASDATQEGDAPNEKKICRTDRSTGSLTRRTRVCMTAAQWRELSSRTYKGVTEMQGSASGSQEVNRAAENGF